MFNVNSYFGNMWRTVLYHNTIEAAFGFEMILNQIWTLMNKGYYSI